MTDIPEKPIRINGQPSFYVRINQCKEGKIVKIPFKNGIEKKLLKKEHAEYINNLVIENKIEKATWEAIGNWCDICGITMRELEPMHHGVEICPNCISKLDESAKNKD